jgi:hypothetical protein
LPWSIWAMMQKLRITEASVRPGWGAAGAATVLGVTFSSLVLQGGAVERSS